jgi:hypothetical protein
MRFLFSVIDAVSYEKETNEIKYKDFLDNRILFYSEIF